MTLSCPLCHVACVHEVLQDYQIQATRENEIRIGGLQVLTCCNGHVFFVRKSDLLMEKAWGAAA